MDESKEKIQRAWGATDLTPPSRSEYRRAKLLQQAATMNDVPEVTRLLFDGVVVRDILKCTNTLTCSLARSLARTSFLFF